MRTTWERSNFLDATSCPNFGVSRRPTHALSQAALDARFGGARQRAPQAAILYQSRVAAMASRWGVTSAPKACANLEWSTTHGATR